MTFKQLEYFAAVARTLSFTEAANEVIHQLYEENTPAFAALTSIE